MKFSHVDEEGNVKMVDVDGKEYTVREATASGKVFVKSETLELVKAGSLKKGDVLLTAKLAGIIAAKRTSELIPLCHNISLDCINIDITCNKEKNSIDIIATAKCFEKTGVEMEVLTAVSVAALTVYDMCKAVDKEMVMGEIRLLEKTKNAIRENK